MSDLSLTSLLAGLAIGLVFGTRIGPIEQNYDAKIPRRGSICAMASLSNGYSRLEHAMDTNNIPQLISTNYTPIKTGETQ